MQTNPKIEKIITSGENIIYVIIILLLFASAALLIYDEARTFIHIARKSFGIMVII